MKKYLLMLTMLLFVTACGNNETEKEPVEADAEVTEDVVTEQEEETNEELDEFIEENDVQLDEDGFFVETTDPLEAGDKNNGIMVYDESGELFIIKEWYMNENTNDDGFNEIDFNNFKFKFAVVLAENVEEEELILLLGETENNTEDEVQFNADIEIVTDQQDQVEFGIGMETRTKPNVKQKGSATANLEYGTPNEFTMTIDAPLKSVGDDTYEEGHYGEPVELEFTKE